MSDSDPFNTSSDNGFPFLLAILAVVAHIFIIVLVLYYTCCRHGCSCKITVGNQTPASEAPQENSDNTQLVESGGATSQENSNADAPPPYSPNAAGPATRQTSVISRVRERLQGRNYDREQSVHLADPESAEAELGESAEFGPQPPPYSEHSVTLAAVGGHVNEGAEFEFVQLPSYQEYMERASELYEKDETGYSEVEKPPKYEDISKP